MKGLRGIFICLVLLGAGGLMTLDAAGKRTIEEAIQPPAGFKRVPVQPQSFSGSLRQIELSDQKELLAGDGKTVLCDDEKVATTVITPFNNQHDTGVDGIVKLWGEYLWKNKPQNSISFPLDNGQAALWKDWRDGLRPKEQAGRFIFTQITTPSGGYGTFEQFLAFASEEMGALALRRESSIILEDSVTVGDLLVALKKDNVSSVGLVLDACKGPRGEKLFLLGTCGTPSTSLYIMRPYSPVQGLNEWFTLDGAKYAIGEGARTDLRRVTLK
jgi:hypothetical protein